VSNPKLPDDFLKFLAGVKGKRARVVVDHILEHGYITTEELTGYGYNHPPRAIRDVREQGIPIETFNVKNAQGRTIAAYRFGDVEAIRVRTGRKAFAKDFKSRLFELQGGRCAICLSYYEERYLQIDHRVPYEVAADEVQPVNSAEFMLLCASCNRAKSWSCEHCENWHKQRDVSICQRCYWYGQENYEHIAMQPIRRLDIVWTGTEVEEYDFLQSKAQIAGQGIREYIKQLLQRNLKRQPPKD
jgi:hypothetical protein